MHETHVGGFFPVEGSLENCTDRVAKGWYGGGGGLSEGGGGWGGVCVWGGGGRCGGDVQRTTAVNEVGCRALTAFALSWLSAKILNPPGVINSSTKFLPITSRELNPVISLARLSHQRKQEGRGGEGPGRGERMRGEKERRRETREDQTRRSRSEDGVDVSVSFVLPLTCLSSSARNVHIPHVDVAFGVDAKNRGYLRGEMRRG